MKRPILALAALFALLATPAHAALTAQTTIPSNIFGGNVTPYIGSLGAGVDETVRTPFSSRNMVCIVGWMFSETSATNLAVKSGSTSLVTLELGANQGVFLPLGMTAPICTQPGQALVLNSSAALSSMIVQVIEIQALTVR